VPAAGKVVSGLAIIETLAYGADLCNSARGMMFALGCARRTPRVGGRGHEHRRA